MPVRARTLRMIIDLGELGRACKLCLVNDETIVRRSRPVSHERVVASNPLSADIRVYLDGVGPAVIGLGGDRHV